MTPNKPLAALVGVVLLAGCTPAGTASAPVASTHVPTSPGATPPGTSGSPEPTASPVPTTASAPCTAEASALSLRARVGQLVMVGVTVDLTASTRLAISRYQLGSAIVMGGTPGGVPQVASLAKDLRKLGGDTGMLVAADQEGGLVQRLKGPGFDTMRSANTQAGLSDAALTDRAEAWGAQMAEAGVLLNLAPVADVVPAANWSSNQPISRLGRGYGSKPSVVSRKVEAFRRGMAAAGIAVAVKHFPGLGAVRGNTDFATKVVDRTTTAGSSLLTPFRDAVRRGANAVMVSSAYYAKIDGERPAMFSPTVIGLLRSWGFRGVVISDDLGAAAALRAVPVAQRAQRFIAAGGDLALNVDASTAGAMAAGLYKAAGDDTELAARVTESAARVLALKAALGQYQCG